MVYDKHRTAFALVEGHVILRDGQKVATIAFKFPRDGAGRLQAFVHWVGLGMFRGTAGGYGYDKRSAACARASEALALAVSRDVMEDPWADAFVAALGHDDGHGWDWHLRAAGFDVLQAI